MQKLSEKIGETASRQSASQTMIEPDFLARACARESADEEAALYAEIFNEVTKEREEAGLSENRIQASAEAMRRLRRELKKVNK